MPDSEISFCLFLCSLVIIVCAGMSIVHVYGQGSPPFIWGNTTLLKDNNTATVVVNDSASQVGISRTTVAQNISTAAALVKENITAPVSPTGISTQSAHSAVPMPK
jgi:hypothetical protein